MLNQSTIWKLRQMQADIKRLMQEGGASSGDEFSASHYLVKAPSGGIPAASGTTPGEATCTLVTRYGSGTKVLTDSTQAVKVYNPTLKAVSEGSHVIAHQDAWGDWFISPVDSEDTILVRNNSEVDVDRGGVLMLDGTVVDEAGLTMPDDLTGVTFNAISPSNSFNTATPPAVYLQVPLYSKRVCVLVEDIANGAIGRAKINGHVPVKIYSEYSEFPKFAGIATASRTERLEAKFENNNFGFPILWREQGTGVKWGIVDMEHHDEPGHFASQNYLGSILSISTNGISPQTYRGWNFNTTSPQHYTSLKTRFHRAANGLYMDGPLTLTGTAFFRGWVHAAMHFNRWTAGGTVNLMYASTAGCGLMAWVGTETTPFSYDALIKAGKASWLMPYVFTPYDNMPYTYPTQRAEFSIAVPFTVIVPAGKYENTQWKLQSCFSLFHSGVSQYAGYNGPAPTYRANLWVEESFFHITEVQPVHTGGGPVSPVGGGSGTTSEPLMMGVPEVVPDLSLSSPFDPSAGLPQELALNQLNRVDAIDVRRNVFTGTATPSTSLGAEGDIYINTSTGAIYTKASGSWSAVPV